MVTVDKNQYGKQKGVGIKPTPNYYQTSGCRLLHISASSTGKQKGLGNFPSPDYYQTVVTQYYIKLKLLVVTIVKRRVALQAGRLLVYSARALSSGIASVRDLVRKTTNARMIVKNIALVVVVPSPIPPSFLL